MRKGLNYALSCRGAWYKWWPQDLDYLPERAPSWSVNGSPPDPSEVIAEGCFCAGVPNLMLRAEGKEIPDHIGDEVWDGGVKAYGDVYWNMGVIKDFDIDDCEEGDLLIRYFDWDRLAATGDQGHVAVVLAGGYVLQSYDAGGGYPGVNSDATIEDSHAGGYYEGMIKAADWIGFDSGEDRAENPHISAGSPLTEEHLVAIAGCSYEVAAKVLPRTLRAMQEFGITTRLQVAAFLANCAQETNWFDTYEEYGDENYFRYGEPGGDGLYLGDEWEYHGRGAIMLTWSDNYRRAGEFFDLDFVGDPDMVKEPNTAWRVAGWYWRYGSSMGDINPLADAGNFSPVVKAINGGWNGWDARVSAYNAALEALPYDLAIATPGVAHGDGGWSWFGITSEGWGQFDGPDCSRGWFDPDWTFHQESWVDPKRNGGGEDASSYPRDGRGEQGRQGGAQRRGTQRQDAQRQDQDAQRQGAQRQGAQRRGTQDQGAQRLVPRRSGRQGRRQ